LAGVLIGVFKKFSYCNQFHKDDPLKFIT
jgi:hypothetical protein